MKIDGTIGIVTVLVLVVGGYFLLTRQRTPEEGGFTLLDDLQVKIAELVYGPDRAGKLTPGDEEEQAAMYGHYY